MNNYNRTYGDDWDIILPCNNKYSEKEFLKINIKNKNQIVSFISFSGVLGSKEYIWKTLVKYYGRNKSSEIMPKSYIFPNDERVFKKEYSPDKYYVMKSEKQRQKGLKITNKYKDIINSRKNGFKIVQEYIKNPVVYKGFKVNFRVYLLIVCSNSNKKEAYIYNDGIISYSEKTYSDRVVDFNSGVSSFYTSKEKYNNMFPITFAEYGYDKINFRGFSRQIVKILNATSSYLCKNCPKYGNKTFQIFGVDFMVTTSGKIYVLEINIGPGMSPFDNRDRIMRIKLHNDMLQIIENKKKINNGFIKIHEF